MTSVKVAILIIYSLWVQGIFGQSMNLKNNNQNLKIDNQEPPKQVHQKHGIFFNSPATLQPLSHSATLKNLHFDNVNNFNLPFRNQAGATSPTHLNIILPHTIKSDTPPLGSTTLAPTYTPKPVIDQVPNSRPILQLNIPMPIINRTPIATCIPSQISPPVVKQQLRNEITVPTNQIVNSNPLSQYAQPILSPLILSPPPIPYTAISAQPIPILTPKLHESSKYSNIKMLLPLLYDLLQEKGNECGCCRNNCGYRKSKSMRVPQIYGGYSTLKNYSPIYNENFLDTSEEREEFDNFCEKFLKSQKKKRRTFKKNYDSEEELDENDDEVDYDDIDYDD